MLVQEIRSTSTPVNPGFSSKRSKKKKRSKGKGKKKEQTLGDVWKNDSKRTLSRSVEV